MDGTVTIGTKLDSSGIETGLNNLSNTVNKKMSGLENTINKTFNRIKKSIIGVGIIYAVRQITKELGDAVTRLDTMKNYTNVMSNLGIDSEQAEASINRLNEALKGLPTTLDQGALAVQRLASANNNVKASTEMFLALNNAILAGGASTQTQATALEQLSQAYAKGKPDMMEWRTMMTAMPAQLNQIAQVMGYGENGASKLGEALRSGEVSMNEFMVTMVKMNKQGLNGFKSLDEQARNATGGIATSIANVKNALDRGLANIMDTIGRSNIAGFFDGIRNAIDKVIPYIQAFIKLIQTAISYIAGLFGKKAKKQTDETTKSVESFGSSISDATNDMDNASGSAGKLNKQLKQLASFDEMNVLSDNSQSSGGSGSGSTSGGATDLSSLDFDFGEYDKVSSKLDEIYEKMLKWANWFTEDMNFEPLANSIKNLGEALDILKSAVGDWIYDFIENFVKPLSTYTINEALPRFFEATATAIKNINFENISNALNNLWTSLEPFAETIGDGLLWFYENVLLPLGTWVISDVVPAFLNILAGAIDIVNKAITDIKPIFEWLWDNFLQPVAEWTGGVIVDILNGIADALNWIAQNEIAMSILEGVAIAIGLVATALGVYSAVTAVATAVSGAFAGVMAVLTSPITLVILAIGALIAIIVLIIKHWDEVKEATQKVWDKIKEILSPVANWFKEHIINPIKKIFTPIIEFFTSIFKTTVANVKIIFNNLVQIAKLVWIGIKAVFSVVSSFFKNIFTTAFNTVKKVFSPIVDFFGGIFNKIKDIFGKIGSAVGNVIGGAFKAVINGVLRAIENILNFPIRSINKLIDVINKVPGISLTKLTTFSLPRLAKGGIINMPGRGVPVGGAIAGERGREAVLPLTDSQQMQLLGEAIGRYITINADIKNYMNGRVISRELQKIQGQNDFAYNR